MDTFNGVNQTGLSSVIKWAGGKEQELGVIFANAPTSFTDYFEPFVGGGAVFAAFPARRHFINDRSEELIDLYRFIATNDECFYGWVDAVTRSWNATLNFVDRHRELCTLYTEYRDNRHTDVGMQTLLFDFVAANRAELEGAIAANIRWHRKNYADEVRKNLARKFRRMKGIEMERGAMPESDIFDNVETAFMGVLYAHFRAIYNDDAIMNSDSALATAFFFFIRNYA